MNLNKYLIVVQIVKLLDEYFQGSQCVLSPAKAARVEDKVPYSDQRVIQGGFFDCSVLKMTKCQPLKEISELFLPKND